MIRLKNIDFSYDQRPFIRHLNLHCTKGLSSVLIGPSGCGKSTVLRLLTGLNRPLGGEIYMDGLLLTPDNLRALRLRTGYVIQEGGLFPHLSAFENVTLMARRLGWPREKISGRITALCTLTQFDAKMLERKPAALSGGQRQRVSLMRALMLNPDILLLDEPFGALDPMIRFQLQKDLKEIIRALNKTVLLVTHDLNEAAFLADTVILMQGGRIEQQGTINDLFEKPESEFVTAFVASQHSHLPGAQNG